AVNPGTEDLVGTSKIFFEKYSTFYDFHLGGHTFPNGAYESSSMVTGYDCISTGSQNMPPSWTNNTDPNVAFDSQGRAYQVTLPFNAFWTNLHPNSNIGIVYSDDLGRTWHLGNGGRPIEAAINSSLAVGFVEDKQWVAVNHIKGHIYQDHVYAAWTVYNGQTAKINISVSGDRGQTFTKRATVTRPAQTGSLNEYVYPMIDAAGNLYLSIASNSPKGTQKVIYVARSTDDGSTFGPWIAATPPIPGFTVTVPPDCCLNGGFRDGILENFAASPTHPGHLYLTWEQWTSGQADIMFAQSTDAGVSWSAPMQVNDPDANDQFQPSIAACPGGRLRSPSTTDAAPVQPTAASVPVMPGRPTSASTPRCRPSRTTAAGPLRKVATSGSRNIRGTRPNRCRPSTACPRWPVRVIGPLATGASSA